jgi:hypothetical protein
MKKPFWKTVIGRILERLLIVGAGMVIKNQKGVKGTENEKIIDDILK